MRPQAEIEEMISTLSRINSRLETELASPGPHDQSILIAFNHNSDILSALHWTLGDRLILPMSSKS